jgi:hypothetical protein
VIPARLNFIIDLNPGPGSSAFAQLRRHKPIPATTPQANPEFKRANDFFNNFEK